MTDVLTAAMLQGYAYGCLSGGLAAFMVTHGVMSWAQRRRDAEIAARGVRVMARVHRRAEEDLI